MSEKNMADERVEFRILDESGLCVVSGSALARDAVREVHHYAWQYAQDGPITIQRKVGRKWAKVDLSAFAGSAAEHTSGGQDERLK